MDEQEVNEVPEGTDVETEQPTEPEVKDSPEETPTEEKETAPETYEDFTMPEGFEVDDAMIGDFLPLAKELGLTQGAAQKLVDLQTKYAKASNDAIVDRWESTLNDWETSLKNDKEIGGDKLDASVAGAKKALDKLGNDQLKEALDMTGAGNHPEIIRFFHRVYQEFLKEDSVSTQTGGQDQVQKKTPEQILFPSMSN